MATSTTDVIIRLLGDDRGATKIRDSLNGVSTQADSTARAMGRLSDEVSNAFSFTAVNAVLNQFAALPTRFDSIIHRGTQFNKTMLNAQNGIAGALRLASPEKFRSFDATFLDSGKMIQFLRVEADAA